MDRLALSHAPSALFSEAMRSSPTSANSSGEGWATRNRTAYEANLTFDQPIHEVDE